MLKTLNKKWGNIHYIDTLFPDRPLYGGYYLFDLPSGVPMAVELIPDSGTTTRLRQCQCCAMRYACQNNKNNPEGKLISMCNWGYFKDFTYLDFETALDLSITLYRAVCKHWKKRDPSKMWTIYVAKLEILLNDKLKGFTPFYRLLLTDHCSARRLLCFLAGAEITSGCLKCGGLTKLNCMHVSSPYCNENPEGVLRLLLNTRRRYRRDPRRFSSIGRQDIATPLRPHIYYGGK